MQPLNEDEERMEKQSYLQDVITKSGLDGTKFFQYLQSLRCSFEWHLSEWKRY